MYSGLISGVRRDTFYTHDVYRWLRAIGVAAEFVEPTDSSIHITFISNKYLYSMYLIAI
jgi:hypothetical protein